MPSVSINELTNGEHIGLGAVEIESVIRRLRKK
jgi:hypothetical protein